MFIKGTELNYAMQINIYYKKLEDKIEKKKENNLMRWKINK